MQNIIRQIARSGQPIPEHLTKSPVLWGGLDLYLQAFLDLNADRQAGMTIMPIPWTSIFAYAKAYGLSAEQTEDLIYHIRYMDDAYMEKMRPQNGNTTGSS